MEHLGEQDLHLDSFELSGWQQAHTNENAVSMLFSQLQYM